MEGGDKRSLLYRLLSDEAHTLTNAVWRYYVCRAMAHVTYKWGFATVVNAQGVLASEFRRRSELVQKLCCPACVVPRTLSSSAARARFESGCSCSSSSVCRLLVCSRRFSRGRVGGGCGQRNTRCCLSLLSSPNEMEGAVDNRHSIPRDATATSARLLITRVQ